ncbi:MAG TPA: cyclic nucleotide-binding domain-containing protein [bacterium]|nr:cyclic nucleotide-binding domain-containing protein [bacterium]
MDDIETYIKRYALRELLSPDLIDELKPIRRHSGEYLINAGDPVDWLLFFVEGKAKVYSRMENGTSLLIRFYRPFDMLGDLELFALDRYLMDVVAISDTLCLGLRSDIIKKRASDNALLLTRICERLGRKLADSNVAAAINLRYPVENRLAGYLLATMDDNDHSTMAASVPCATHDLGELADLLGASYRQLGRVVRNFRDQGILEARRGRLVIADRRKLEPLAKDCYR